MKIGIIVYSVSGHTLDAAQHLRDHLVAADYSVSLERLELVGPQRVNNEQAALKSNPLLANYDVVVLCTPVRGGTMAPPMRRFLEQLPALKDHRFALLVTHFFRPAWGADQTIAALRNACEARGARVIGAASVRWSGIDRAGQLKQALDTLTETIR